MMRWAWPVRFSFRGNAKRAVGRTGRWPKRTLAVEALEERALLSTFTVINTNDSGPGSLRQAILDSNGSPGQNIIQFKIANSGVQTITPLTALPIITNSVIMDGTTEGGFDPNNPKPMIELNGSSAGYGVVGLHIQASQTTVKGLVIDSFKSLGIYLSGSQDVIQTCYIGTSVDGSTALSNGVEIQYGSNNTVGGASAGAGDTISGGLEIYGSTGNVIEGNRIGTTPDGLTALSNTAGDAVVLVFGASSNVIGGTVAGSGNVISGNKGNGIDLESSGTSGNLIEGNYIGTNVTGNAVLPNTGYGVFIYDSASNNTVGGVVSGAANTISGNSYDGVHLEGSGITGTLIEGNHIGTNAAGTAALPNGLYGVNIYNGANNNTVGGTAAGAGNIISGNKGYGVNLYGSGVSGNLVQGNRIGTTADGKTALANGNDGVSIAVGASSNTVGGTAAGAGNVISGNQREGISIFASGTTQNLVEGNFIGTTADGSAPLPNGIQGVAISGGATSNTVGGTAAGAGNLVSGNGANGVGIDGSGTTGNLVEGNYIGTNAAGTVALGNGHSGVSITASGNTVGGTATGAGNVISGNGSPSAGVGIAGILIGGSGTTGNLVQGNRIGTTADGSAALPNREAGVELQFGPGNNTIGGTAAGAGNIISGNAGYGVYFDYYLTAMTGNLVEGNRIGTSADGSAPLPNQSHGVYIFKDPHDTSGSNIGASNNTIGGTSAGAGNLIAYNGGAGVDVLAGTGNAILDNVIYGNKGIGIDLGSDGVTLNDSKGHTGPNNYQDFPIFSASGLQIQLDINSRFSSIPSQTCHWR